MPRRRASSNRCGDDGADAEEPAGDFFRWADREMEEANRGISLPCQRGCSYCCHGNAPNVSPADQAVLLEGLNELDGNRLGTILQEAVRQSRLAEESIPDDMEMREPCPLLEHEECLVYHHRPLACRLYGSAESGEGAIYGCDAVRLRLAFTGDRLVNIKTVTAPFELRHDAKPELSLIDWLAGLRGGHHGRRGD